MRVFVGIELPPRVRETCVTLMQTCQACVDGRWALAENLHVTLAFVGQIDPAQIPSVEMAMRAVAARFEPPRLSLAAPGTFEKRGGAILYCGVDASPALEPVHNALCDALQAQGLPCDPGPFRAHITLARKARVYGVLPQSSAADFAPDYLTLFESARDRQDVLRYTPRLRCAWKTQ